MTSKLPDSLRADAIAQGGAAGYLASALNDPPSEQVSVWCNAIEEILTEALQSRRTIANLKAQHDRELAATIGSYCPDCGDNWAFHDVSTESMPKGCQAAPFDSPPCGCLRTVPVLQGYCKPSPDPVANDDGMVQGERASKEQAT